VHKFVTADLKEIITIGMSSGGVISPPGGSFEMNVV
jgi:hypothetical protein